MFRTGHIVGLSLITSMCKVASLPPLHSITNAFASSMADATGSWLSYRSQLLCTPHSSGDSGKVAGTQDQALKKEPLSGPAVDVSG